MTKQTMNHRNQNSGRRFSPFGLCHSFVIRHSSFVILIRALALFVAVLGLAFAGCDRNLLTGSKLTPSNYDQITPGMSKAQVEKILGPPTSVETKDMLIFKKTTYRYEDGKKFAIITFKNDEVDSKDSNLGREP
jgi:outer membrane protein assembly factor BamE (lipoprotein component of BamABCDE complex)